MSVLKLILQNLYYPNSICIVASGSLFMKGWTPFVSCAYGHTLDSCPTNSDTKEAASDMDTHTDTPPVVAEDVSVPMEEERPELFANHGPWMLAEKKRRGRPKGPMGVPVERTSASRGSQCFCYFGPTYPGVGSETMPPFSQPHVQSKIHKHTTPYTCSLKDSPHVTVSPFGTLPCLTILEVSSPSVPVPSPPKPPDGQELSSLRIFPPNNSTDVTMKPGPVSQTVAPISKVVMDSFTWKSIPQLKDAGYLRLFMSIRMYRLNFANLLTFSLTVGRPWVIMGDFNEILDATGKQGRVSVDTTRCAKFRDWINHCRLRIKVSRDLSTLGEVFHTLMVAYLNGSTGL
ncbi:hypothetical protein Tsubulata_000975 [Turnera subulata]|uniref:Endonuclease/exonuclease/phosphatase domain-containing protein n=1 Tax=Turnera subulata TaxID=218843 RepID=A0A9Q0FDC9_9ROSI|nr:hypothetical protein Tsubulata_000975 [Turnera subulata]